MKDLIKEKLLKDLKKYKKEDGTMAYDEYGTDLGIYDWGRIITILEAKLQQHEETSKAKDEEFNQILDEIEKNNWMYADMDEAEFWITSTITQEEANIRANHTSAIIEEIKQMFKGE